VALSEGATLKGQNEQTNKQKVMMMSLPFPSTIRTAHMKPWVFFLKEKKNYIIFYIDKKKIIIIIIIILKCFLF